MGTQLPDFPVKSFNRFRPVRIEETKNIIKNLNKTTCSIDPFNFKHFDFENIVENLAQIFHDIVNVALKTGIFPVSEKNAVVKPLIKGSKDTENLASYRPVFHTSFLSKFIEKCVLLQLLEHMESFNAIPKMQSAYKKFHSVETAITKIYNDLIIKKSTGKCSMLILLDLSAAFDCIDQEILLDDLRNLGIGGEVLSLLESYLRGRFFKVEIGDSSSQSVEMTTGICQGTILAPTLFSIYTIELYYILTNMGIKCHFYADDTQFLIDVENECQAQQDFSTVFKKIVDWMASRKLKLNSDKTECILIGNDYHLRKFADFKYVRLALADGKPVRFS